jgi:hypothetical protein
MRHCALLTALLLGWLCADARLAGQERPSRPPLTPAALQENLRADWFGVYLKAAKVGYRSTAMARAGGTEPGYVVTTRLRTRILSGGEELDECDADELEFEGQAPFALRRATTSQRSGKSQHQVTLVRTDKGFRVTTKVVADTTTKDFPPIDYTLADHLACSPWLRGHPAPGSTLLTRALDLENLRLDLERRKMLGARTVLVKGVKVTRYEVECVNLRDKTTAVEHYDAKGNLVLRRIGACEERLEPEAQARDVKTAVDLYALGLVKIDRALGEPTTVTGLVVEVVGKGAALLESGPWQTVTQNPSGTSTCKVGKRYGREARATPEELKDGLSDSVAYPANHPRVQALARKAVGDAREPREKVERLVHFVHGYLQPNEGVNETIVLDLLERKEGDCKGFAALFTTLARAAGIPSRVVNGLYYDGDEQKAFGGHAWNEVVLDGRWVPVDASLDQFEVDATHINFGSEAQLLRTFGDLSLRLVEVRRRNDRR